MDGENGSKIFKNQNVAPSRATGNIRVVTTRRPHKTSHLSRSLTFPSCRYLGATAAALSLFLSPFAHGQGNSIPDSVPSTPAEAAATVAARTTHALSLFENIKYGPDFEYFDYVNPDAPKGGRMRLHTVGGFDTLNSLNINGTSAIGSLIIYDTLLQNSLDEPSTEYGLLAESVEVPSDYSWVTYTLRKDAYWHDGMPITPEDVIFSLNTLKEKGLPLFRFYYANIVRGEKIDEHKVKFVFDQAGNRELPQITGQMVILPKHYWESTDKKGDPRDFGESTLDPPLGSGPYRIKDFEPNRHISYERVKDYWGADLPVNAGQNNFDELRYEYYRDREVALTAFLADEYDIRAEFTAKHWATRYDVPPVNKGFIKREFIPSNYPLRMQGFVFNTRLPKFQDRRVREAIGLAYNFEWANKYLFYGIYKRINSYFEPSELSARGLPSEEELKLLEPYRDRLPEDVFTKEFRAPMTDGSGKYRKNLVKALELLSAAGWSLKNGQMTNDDTGEVLTIEFLIVQTTFERVIQPYLRDLERIGIKGTIRLVDTSQYINRRDKFDFEMMVYSRSQTLSPGNEQREFWGSEAADREGSDNVAGIRDPVVDAFIEKIIFSKNRKELITATRALDRVLLWGHYVVPHWYSGGTYYAYWDRFEKPDIVPPYGDGIPSIWWYKGEPDGMTAEDATDQYSTR